MRLFLLFITAFFLFSCETSFQESSGGFGGYKVTPLEQPKFYTHVASFSGNAYTNSKKARIYSKMAAVKFCSQKSSFPISSGAKNFSTTYRDNEVSTVGTYTYSYPVTRTYPKFSVFFRCDTKLNFFPGLPKYRMIKAELIKDLVSDFKGAVQIEAFSLPKEKGALLENDVILEFNDQRVTEPMSLMQYLNEVNNMAVHSVKIIRNKKVKTIKVKLKDHMYENKTGIALFLAEYCSQVKFVGSSSIKSCVVKEANKINLGIK